MVVLITLISFYARHLLQKQNLATNELAKYKNELENIVELRAQSLKEEIETRKRAAYDLEIIATTDSLTSIFNRRKFNEILNFEIKRECRYRNGLILILCDIGKFKDINDSYGHIVGDEVLKLFYFSHIQILSLRQKLPIKFEFKLKTQILEVRA